MQAIRRIPSGIPHLDTVLGGGIPAFSFNILAGEPGTGKTILAQQILFNYLDEHDDATVLYLTTLSEPTIKVLRYMQEFSFFTPDTFGEQMLYHDIGHVVRERSLSAGADHVTEMVAEHRPDLVVIDSYKAIRDLAKEAGAFRRFTYDLSVELTSARCTTFLIGEYERADVTRYAEFAIADGIFYLTLVGKQGEQSRVFQIFKLRGSDPKMAPFPFVIDESGIRILGSALTLKRRPDRPQTETTYLTTGVSGLDAMVGEGIPRGRAVILSGLSGTGKTTLALQFLVEGAEHGQPGVLFSFEETPDRLHEMAEGFGWNLTALEAQGLLRIVFIPQAEIRVEEDLERMTREVQACGAVRFVVDSFSVFLHRVKDPAVQREKTFQLVSLVQQSDAVGILISDIPAHTPHQLSRFGVEETVADGTIVLSSELEGLKRRRYLEVYKMRGIEHVHGRHRMEIKNHGIQVLYAQPSPQRRDTSPIPLVFEPLGDIIKGDLFHGANWLVRGEPGVGKSTLAYQFVIDGLCRNEAVLHITADAPAVHILRALENLGLSPELHLESGMLRILEAFGNGAAELDLHDPEAFLFAVARQVEAMPKPLRVVFDSLTPLTLGHTGVEFVALMHRKQRLLSRFDATIFDVLLRQALNENFTYRLLNSYEIVLDLYTPDWGQMNLAGDTGYRVLQVHKARGVGVDHRPFPYVISPTDGIMIQQDYYRKQMGT